MGGPQIKWEWNERLAIQVQAIYRPLRSSVQASLPEDQGHLSLQDHRTTREFPLLAQYRWHISRAHPFVEAGPSFRLLQDVYGAAPHGASAGVGVETRVGRIRISPGLLFTHWARHSPRSSTDPRQSEFALLTGFSF